MYACMHVYMYVFIYTILNTTETSTSKSKDISKNDNTASVLNSGQQENVNFFTVINFVEQTIKTLTNYREHLKTQLDFNLTQQDM